MNDKTTPDTGSETPPAPPRETRRQRHRCVLTPDERLLVGTELSTKLSERDTVEAEKKAVAKQYSDRLGGLDTTITELKDRFLSGSEERELDVYDVRDIFAKLIRTHRADTGELIDERAMKPFELQLELEDARKKAVEDGRPDAEIIEIEKRIKAVAEQKQQNDRANAATEEQLLAESPEEAERLRDHRLTQEAMDREAAGAPPAALLSSTGIKRGRDRNPDPPAGSDQ